MRRYLFLLLALGAGIALWLANRETGARAADITISNLKEMLLVLPPIFIILGLLDVWVPRERMIKLMKKGARMRNVLILLGSWSATKIPMLMFELTSMGARFNVTRLVVDLAGILLIAYVMERFMGERDRQEILAKAEG